MKKLVLVLVVFLTACSTLASVVTPTIVAEVKSSPTFTSTVSLPSITPSPGITPLPPTETPAATIFPVIEITDVKGVPMMLVPAGEFIMGDTVDNAMAECQNYQIDCSREWFTNEEPVHKVFLDAFYIDKYEVTNALYKTCVDKGICQRPKRTDAWTFSNYYGQHPYDNYPVVYVDWNMAAAYCRWRAARLPTEAEWEKAARGTDGRTYAWGAKFDSARANYFRSPMPLNTMRVQSFPNGQSQYGVFNMTGNVWEWVADWYQSDYYSTLNDNTVNPKGSSKGQERVLRGGGWLDNVSSLRAAYRFNVNPTFNGYDAGIRCARSVP
jgi:formylglycine-generating enzyme required for sulfatase activity